MSIIVRKTYYWESDKCNHIEKDLIELFVPQTHKSKEYKNWIAILDLKTCLVCRNCHGKIYKFHEQPIQQPPVHNNCHCEIVEIDAVYAGGATQDGVAGADYVLKQTGVLPDCYITKKTAKKLGWSPILGNLNIVAPGMQIGGDVFQNRNGHLPIAEGRIWYEADINYDFGYRNHHRILYSNDGLIFATYDHYMTFVQVQ